jgi:hypothetical protein
MNSSADVTDDDCGMAYLLNKSATGAVVATVSVSGFLTLGKTRKKNRLRSP